MAAARPRRSRLRESPFARRARERKQRQQARERAPRHPVVPEARIRLAISRLFGTYHKHIRQTVVSHAPQYLMARKAHRANPHAMDTQAQPMARDDDEADKKDSHTGIAALFMLSVFNDLWHFGRNLLAHGSFGATVRANADKTAANVTQQVAKATGRDPDAFAVDLTPEAVKLYGEIYDLTADQVEASVERASDVLDEWADLDPDTSPRAEDTDALDGMLDDGLAGIVGTALQGAALAFGYAFADMNRAAQKDVGVDEYYWITQNDSHVRPEHRALDGQICSWDDPPLSASESSSGEACHPGDDYGCRCVAAPVPPGQEES